MNGANMDLAKKVVRSRLLPIGVIVASSGFIVWGAAPAPEPSAAPGVFMVDALEERTVDTADDWASAADLVVTATVVDETEIRPSSETAGRGGFDLIGRTVEVNVDDILWRSPDVTRTVPSSLTFDAFGWMEGDKGPRQEVASHGSARLEVGHSYVLGLFWRPAECSVGDATHAAHWSVLSSGTILPADDGVVGRGEFEGRLVGPVKDQHALEDRSGSVLAQFRGKAATKIAPALQERRATRSASKPTGC